MGILHSNSTGEAIQSNSERFTNEVRRNKIIRSPLFNVVGDRWCLRSTRYLTALAAAIGEVPAALTVSWVPERNTGRFAWEEAL